MNAGALLLAGAGLVMLAMGLEHARLTLRDALADVPRAFTPRDDAVRLAMLGTSVAFSRRANLWRAWLGFNLSHSLGVVGYGAGLIALAGLGFERFAGSPAVQLAAATPAVAYLAISLAFWFRGPSVGCALALLGIVGAALL